MSQLKSLVATIEDAAVSDAEPCLASDRLAAALDAVIKGPASLPAKIEAIRIAEARDWDAMLPGCLSLLAFETTPS